jgi:hypothetical protein
LLDKGILVLRRPIGQMVDELFDLLPRRFVQGFGPAEVKCIRLHQDWIELVLTNEQAETIA